MQITLLNSRHNSEDFDIVCLSTDIFLQRFVVPKTVLIFLDHLVYIMFITVTNSNVPYCSVKKQVSSVEHIYNFIMSTHTCLFFI